MAHPTKILGGLTLQRPRALPGDAEIFCDFGADRLIMSDRAYLLTYLLNVRETAILTTVGLGVALGVVVGVSLLLATLAYCKRCDLFK